MFKCVSGDFLILASRGMGIEISMKIEGKEDEREKNIRVCAGAFVGLSRSFSVVSSGLFHHTISFSVPINLLHC